MLEVGFFLLKLPNVLDKQLHVGSIVSFIFYNEEKKEF